MITLVLSLVAEWPTPFGIDHRFDGRISRGDRSGFYRDVKLYPGRGLFADPHFPLFPAARDESGTDDMVISRGR